MEDKLRELAIKHLPKAFYQYGYKGFTCQVHYPELCKIVKDYEADYKQSIIELIDSMTKEFIDTDETVTHLQETVHDAKIRALVQLKQKIEAL